MIWRNVKWIAYLAALFLLCWVGIQLDKWKVRQYCKDYVEELSQRKTSPAN